MHASIRSVVFGALILAGPVLHAQSAAPQPAAPGFDLGADQPGQIEFFGTPDAELFAKEIHDSFEGVLERSYVSIPGGGFPLGFINASPPPQPASGEMWTRDTGAFMREMIAWGDLEHACQTAQCLMNLSAVDADGFIEIPRFFKPGENAPPSELDGQAGIVIAFVSLWQRLPADDPFRARLHEFLSQKSSPVRYLHHALEQAPLIAGAGEFGPGCAIDGMADNVVQNAMSAVALLAAAGMAQDTGDAASAAEWRHDAATIFADMDKYLADKNGGWFWCIDPKTLQPDQKILQTPVNIGFGGLNGAFCIPADVLGFDPASWKQQDLVAHGRAMFDELYAVPLRREQFEKYGIWTQFDVFRNGLSTGPSYGHGYALQTMLLLDKLDMAEHAIDYMAEATYHESAAKFPTGRLSPYYFNERLNSPDAPADVKNDTGCGPLNLVNVAEPLKAARLIVGVDDTQPGEVRLMPRVPPSWTGYRADNWPILTSHGIVRVDLWFERKEGKATLQLKVRSGGAIPVLAVRMPAKNGWTWEKHENVRELHVACGA